MNHYHIRLKQSYIEAADRGETFDPSSTRKYASSSTTPSTVSSTPQEPTTSGSRYDMSEFEKLAKEVSKIYARIPNLPKEQPPSSVEEPETAVVDQPQPLPSKITPTVKPAASLAAAPIETPELEPIKKKYTPTTAAV